MLKVYGNTIDDQTRCSHYHNKVDVIAIKFKCCNKYYPCFKCHNENENHKVVVWPKNEFGKKAILCGVCKKELTIEAYLRANSCPFCHTPFNPACEKHYDHYFDLKQCPKGSDE